MCEKKVGKCGGFAFSATVGRLRQAYADILGEAVQK